MSYYMYMRYNRFFKIRAFLYNIRHFLACLVRNMHLGLFSWKMWDTVTSHYPQEWEDLPRFRGQGECDPARLVL
jgi:hypothetical protein